MYTRNEYDNRFPSLPVKVLNKFVYLHITQLKNVILILKITI